MSKEIVKQKLNYFSDENIWSTEKLLFVKLRDSSLRVH